MPDQLTAEQVRRMYAERRYDEISQARAAGRLADVLGGERPIPADQRLSRDDVQRLYAERRYSEIDQLRAAGRLDHLLNPTTEEN